MTSFSEIVMRRGWKQVSLAAIVAAWLAYWGSAHCSAQQAAQPIEPGEIRQVSISPAADEPGALLLRLFPASEDLEPRNAALYYHRATELFQQNVAAWRETNARNPDRKTPTLWDNYDLWMDSPLDEMPVEDMKNWLERMESVLVELRRAGRSSQCDWGILPADSDDIGLYDLTLQDLQHMRNLARLLVVRARVLIAEHRYEEAVETFRLGYKLSNDVGESRILIGSLIGIASARMMNDPLLLFMQQDDSPNLFWGLQTMPRPLVDSKEAVRTEMQLFATDVFEISRDPENSDRTIKAWRHAMVNDLQLASRWLGQRDEATPWATALFTIRGYPIAKQALAAHGFEKQKLDAMPAAQVVAIYQTQLLYQLRDETIRWLSLPYPQMAESRRQYVDYHRRTGLDAPPDLRLGLLPVTDLLPANTQVVEAEIHLQREMACLQVIEAIRWHLAESGQLPSSLAEIKVVPAPHDPSTGNPFPYELSGEKASLFVPDRIKSRSVKFEILINQ